MEVIIHFTFYLTEKTFRLYYKDQSVNTIYVGGNDCS